MTQLYKLVMIDLKEKQVLEIYMAVERHFLDAQASLKQVNNIGLYCSLTDYSLVRLVWQNTEELISRPFTGLYKIRLLLRDRMRTKNLRF